MEAYERLEYEWAVFLTERGWGGSRRNVVACSSGTAALHLALEAMTIPAGSVVLVPDFTMIACARAVTLAGLVPQFIDCRPDDLLMDAAEADRAVTYRTNAVMPVHVYGRQCDVDAVHSTAERYGLVVVEDCAEAHGLVPHPKTDAACWSFYKNKIVAGEEGGCVVFRDPARADLARKLRCLGFTDAHDYTHVPRGHNYRMSNVHAGLILDGLRAYPSNLITRRMIESEYNHHCPPAFRLPPREAPWVYDLRVPGMTREKQDVLVATLRESGVAARHGFKPMSVQKEYAGRAATMWERPTTSPNAERASREVIYLPCGPELYPGDVRKAMNLVRSVTGS